MILQVDLWLLFVESFRELWEKLGRGRLSNSCLIFQKLGVFVGACFFAWEDCFGKDIEK